MSKIKSINLEKGADKVLVDTTEIEELPGSISLYSLFSEYPYHIKTALVNSQKNLIFNDLYFAESVAQNRGIKVRAFLEKEEALKWLNDPAV
jgi:hypothetical protein